MLGLSFEYHSHGKSPMHYSAKLGGAILEIYPLLSRQATSDKSLRIGFGVPNFKSVIESLKAAGVEFVREPADTQWGYMAVIKDSDERQVELYSEPDKSE